MANIDTTRIISTQVANTLNSRDIRLRDFEPIKAFVQRKYKDQVKEVNDQERTIYFVDDSYITVGEYSGLIVPHGKSL